MEANKEQVFIIADVKFKLKDDLELDESIEASKLLNLFFSPKGNTVIAETTADDIKKFLSIVLVPADGKKLPDDFNFGKVRKSIITKTILTFFLKLITETADTERDCEILIKEHLKQLKNIKT